MPVEKPQHPLASHIEGIDQAGAASPHPADPPVQGGHRMAADQAVEDTAPGPGPVRCGEIREVESFKLVSSQAAQTSQVAQDGQITLA